MAEHLKNGAEVIARDKAVVLAYWKGQKHPWVTWQVDRDDNAYWGHYFGDYDRALLDFVHRGANQ